MKHGDFHNFGRRVEENERESRFVKPRSVFWEYLFFGKGSPLEPLLSRIPCADRTFSDFFCRLDVETNDSFKTGSVNRIDASDACSLPYLKFGALAAYATVLGLQDLHAENVIFDALGPIPVDVEVALSQLTLPNETHLFQRTKSGALQSPFAAAGKTWKFQQSQFFELLDGFTLTAAALAAIADELRATIEASSHSVPVRVLARPTRFYREWLLGQNREAELLPEEKIQLERGDVPYFFKYVGAPQVYYYTSEDGATAEAPVDGSAFARPASELISFERIVNTTLPYATLFFLRNLQPEDWRGQWKNSVVEIESADGFAVTFGQRTFRSQR